MNKLIDKIHQLASRIPRRVRIMEVCGTHTVAIFRAGIRSILPHNVELVSGPGCPVCVTPQSFIDQAIAYANSDFIIATFGDLLKVPGSQSSLADAQADGADIRVLYSPLDSIHIATSCPDKNVLFLAVGFETTSPTAAALVLHAQKLGIRNLFLLNSHKLVPPVLRALMADPQVHVDAFLLPGHVAVVTGSDAFNFVSSDLHTPAVISGFEPILILNAIAHILDMLSRADCKVLNCYHSVVSLSGNVHALNILRTVYSPADSIWRGLGLIESSGLAFNPDFADFDVLNQFPLDVRLDHSVPAGCSCDKVLKGIIPPNHCPLFAKACTPLRPVGPCMVSVEGVCSAWFKYGRHAQQ